MPQVVSDLIHFLLVKNWYASGALLVMVLTQLGKSLPKLRTIVWDWVPVGYRFLVPSVLAFAGAFVHGYQLGEPFSKDVWDAVWIAIGAMGGNAVLTESPLPWNGSAGGVPAPTSPPNAPPPPPAAA